MRHLSFGWDRGSGSHLLNPVGVERIIHREQHFNYGSDCLMIEGDL